jgi:hypothetical protein
MTESNFMNNSVINLNKKIIDYWVGYANKAAELSYSNSLLK